MQTVEEFKKDIVTGGNALKSTFGTLTSRAENTSVDRDSLLWRTYVRNRDLQKRVIEEIQHAISMPELAPEVLNMRHSLWQEFVASVKALHDTPRQEKEQDLTTYKDKHPTTPREEELAVFAKKEPPKPFVRVKPKPTFTKPKPIPETTEIPLKKEDIVLDPEKKKMKEVAPVEPSKPKSDVALPKGTLEKVRQSIIERVGKNAQGFLDGIFGSLGNDDAGLSKVEKLTLSNIIKIEKLSPDAHTAKLDDIGITQKEWEGWIDWVNESNKIIPANVSSTLGEYLTQVARHIAQKK